MKRNSIFVLFVFLFFMQSSLSQAAVRYSCSGAHFSPVDPTESVFPPQGFPEPGVFPGRSITPSGENRVPTPTRHQGFRATSPLLMGNMGYVCRYIEESSPAKGSGTPCLALRVPTLEKPGRISSAKWFNIKRRFEKQRHSPRFKTEMCKNEKIHGHCIYKEYCIYCHKGEKLRNPCDCPNYRKSRCALRGQCPLEREECWYIHLDPEGMTFQRAAEIFDWAIRLMEWWEKKEKENKEYVFPQYKINAMSEAINFLEDLGKRYPKAYELMSTLPFKELKKLRGEKRENYSFVTREDRIQSLEVSLSQLQKRRDQISASHAEVRAKDPHRRSEKDRQALKSRAGRLMSNLKKTREIIAEIEALRDFSFY